MTSSGARTALASLAAAAVLFAACGDDDATDDPGVENQEEVDAGDTGTTVRSGGGTGGTGGTGADQGNVEPDGSEDTTQQTSQGPYG